MKKFLRIINKFINTIFYCIDQISSYIIAITLKGCGKGVKFRSAFTNRILFPENINIGSNFSSMGHLYLYGNNGKISIGNNCAFNTNIQIGASNGEIIIGNYVLIASNVVIRASDHIYKDPDIEIRKQGHKSGKILIEDDVWIGSNSVILKDVKIGRGSIIAAGSVVTKNIEPFSIVAGTPAVKIGKRER
tara:strand:- start:398 stop:967 length:570 start_codon:yes stop_codon:yes gene_type:complete